ncbi:MAG TPA: HEAT repeat domain-containing protein [Candidatus Acidoferrum sp.]|nr:HEAT repeat domain-containing protein [Candidatus Acidoferrum sp.]
MWKNFVVGVVLLVLAVTVVWQGQAIREIRRHLVGPASGEPVSTSTVTPASIATSPSKLVIRAPGAEKDDALQGRVGALEDAVAQLTKASEYLMVRGQLPLASNKVAELQQKFMDANAIVRERMQALGLLRRNGALNDAVVQHALSWIQSATNSGLRENLVRQLGGATNSLLREPMLKLASSDPEPDVREQAVENLQRFIGDPKVESLLWDMMRTEADRGVKEQVAEALREGPMTPARLAEMRNRAVDGNSSLDERLIAVQALREAGAGSEDITASLAQFVQSTQNPDDRARVFGAFDGGTDPQMKLPLVYGLQDANANVRARAADALSGYGSDPAVAEWLTYVAQNDSDFRVRREAEEALRESRRGGQGQRERRDGPPGGRGR